MIQPPVTSLSNPGCWIYIGHACWGRLESFASVDFPPGAPYGPGTRRGQENFGSTEWSPRTANLASNPVSVKQSDSQVVLINTA